MAHSVPTPKVTPTPDPLINLAETGAEVQNQRNKQGMLASFLQGRNRGSGFLSNAMSRQPTLGSATV